MTELLILAGVVLVGISGRRKPSILFAAYVATTCMSGLSITILGITLLPEHFALVFLIIATSIYSRRSWAKFAPITYPPATLLAGILFCVWLVLSLLVNVSESTDTSHSVKLLFWIVGNFVAFLVICRWRLPAVQLVKSGLVAVTVMGSIASLGWAIAVFSNSRSNFVELDYASTAFRAKGLMLEPNLLASLCLLWVCLCYTYRHEIPRKLCVTSVGVLGFCIIVSYTRTAWLLLAVVVFLLGVKQASAGVKVAMVVGFIVGSLVLIAGGPAGVAGSISAQGGPIQALVVRVGNLDVLDEGTGRFRANVAEMAVEEIGSPGFEIGYGTNSFTQRHASKLTSDGQLYLGLLWLAVLYDTGYLGFAIFVSSFGLFWWSVRRGATLAMLAFVVVSTTTNPIWYVFPWIILAVNLLSVGKSEKSTDVRDVAEADDVLALAGSSPTSTVRRVGPQSD